MILSGNNPEPNTITYSGHNKKFCYKNYVYLPILKNAHRFTSALFSAYGFELNPDVSLQDKTKLVVLRNPVKRWFAGISQILYWHTPNIVIDRELVNLLTHIIVLDGHTRSQYNYLKNINTEECIFFNMDDPNYEDYLKHFARVTIGGTIDTNNLGYLQPSATSTRNEKYKEIKSELEKRCEDIFIKRLETYYQEDLQLLNTVQFYRGSFV